MPEVLPLSASIEQRLAALEKEIAELRAEMLTMTPREKDWQRTAGTMPNDEFSRSAARLGREWRAQKMEP